MPSVDVLQWDRPPGERPAPDVASALVYMACDDPE